jgi:hypothetical protein
VAAEHKVLEVLRAQAESDTANTEEAQAQRARLERELAAAHELTQRLTQQGNATRDWRIRAEALLAEAPSPIAAGNGKKRTIAALFGGAVLCGATAATLWIMHDPRSPAGLAQMFALHVATQPAPASHVTVRSDRIDQASKLQLSYEMHSQPFIELADGKLAGETIAQASEVDKE